MLDPSVLVDSGCGNPRVGYGFCSLRVSCCFLLVGLGRVKNMLAGLPSVGVISCAG